MVLLTIVILNCLFLIPLRACIANSNEVSIAHSVLISNSLLTLAFVTLNTLLTNAKNAACTNNMVSYTDIRNYAFNEGIDKANSMLSGLVYQNCSSPTKMRVYDPVVGHFVFKEMPCGHCWHCTSAKTADFVTRMLLHSETWKYQYFVTLSYASYDTPYMGAQDDFYNRVLYQEFAPTYPLFDNLNYHGRYCWSPSLLSREHLRNYLKRLRADNKGIEFSYFAVGEYGSQFARPHYHLLIFTKERVQDTRIFESPWAKSYCVKDGQLLPYRGQKGCSRVESVSFGDVKVVSLDRPEYILKGHEKTWKVDFFKYVSKYIYKFQAYDAKEQNAPYFTKNDTKVLRNSKLFRNFAADFNLKRIYYYECKCIPTLDPSFDMSAADLPKLPYNYKNLVRKFSPFGVSSHKYAIGKDFFNQHADRLCGRSMQLPVYDGVQTRFPAYYRKLINQRVQPLRVCKPTSNGFTLSIGALPNYREFADVVIRGVDSEIRDFVDRFISRLSIKWSQKLHRDVAITNAHLFDLSTKEHIFLDSATLQAYSYVYDCGCLVFNDLYTFAQLVDRYEQGFAEYVSNYLLSNQRIAAEQACRRDTADFYTSLGYDFDRIIADASARMYDELAEHQRQYKAEKKRKKQLYIK